MELENLLQLNNYKTAQMIFFKKSEIFVNLELNFTYFGGEAPTFKKFHRAAPWNFFAETSFKLKVKLCSLQEKYSELLGSSQKIKKLKRLFFVTDL